MQNGPLTFGKLTDNEKVSAVVSLNIYFLKRIKPAFHRALLIFFIRKFVMDLKDGVSKERGSVFKILRKLY